MSYNQPTFMRMNKQIRKLHLNLHIKNITSKVYGKSLYCN